MILVKCKVCGREIFWAKSPRGSNIPMDSDRVVTYTIIRNSDPPQLHANADAYQCHYNTCRRRR